MSDTLFEYGSQVFAERFLNREQEQRRLEANFSGGQNTILISPRRWGKSSLVSHMQQRMRKRHPNVRFCFIDMSSVRSEKEFYELMVLELMKATTTKLEERLKAFKQFVRGIVPKLSLAIGQETEFALSIDLKDARKHFSEIIDLPERIAAAKGLKIVMCLDEFQSITFFDRDIVFQRKLRAHWQKHRHTCYCLYGSKRHMMTDIFENPQMPFFKFGDLVMLGKIDEKYWLPFIEKVFNTHKKKIDPKYAKEIVQRMESFPYYIQQYGKEVLLNTSKSVTPAVLETALQNIIVRNTIFYQREVEQLSNTQFNLLKAIVSGVERLTTNETIRRFDLGNSPNVLRAKEALRNKDIIDDFGKQIIILDPVFKIWFASRHLPRFDFDD